jgi:hypothetical protein
MKKFIARLIIAMGIAVFLTNAATVAAASPAEYASSKEQGKLFASE